MNSELADICLCIEKSKCTNTNKRICHCESPSYC